MAQTKILSQDVGAGEIDNDAIGSNAVTTIKITDANITLAKMAANSVNSANIVDATIVAGDIANTTITGGKLVNDTITALQIAANAVTSSELADDAVDTAAIVDAAVTTAKIADDNITLAKIQTMGANTIIIGDGSGNPSAAVVSGDITLSPTAVATIGALKIENGMLENDAVSSAKLATNSVQLDALDEGISPTWSGNHTFNNAVVAATAPAADNQLANKGYVDSVAEGLDVKDSCKAIATANISLSGAQTIDGVSILAGDRVLVSGQTSGVNNGIYIAAAPGAWARSSDLPVGSDAAGAFAFIEQGTVNEDNGFVCTNNKGDALVGTDALVFSQFSASGLISAGAGLTKTGNTLDVIAGNSIQVNADSVQVANAGITVTQLADGAVNSAKILDGAIVNADVNASAAIHGSKLAAASVGTTEFENVSVTTAILANDGVTSQKIAANSVITVKILDANVTLGKLANNSVNSSKIVDASIMLADLNAEVTNAMSGFTSRTSITVPSDGTTSFAEPANFPATDYKGLIFVNGRLMKMGAGFDYTLSGGNIVFATGRFTDDVIETLYDSTAA